MQSNDPRFDYGRGDRWIRDWAERHNVSHIELGPPLANIGRRKVFWRDDQHLNREGHAAVAGLLYDFLLKPRRKNRQAPENEDRRH